MEFMELVGVTTRTHLSEENAQLHVDFRPIRPITWACTLSKIHLGREKW